MKEMREIGEKETKSPDRVIFDRERGKGERAAF
jgi:hypothetical protein